MTGLVRGIAGGQIFPGCAGAHDPENSVQDIARIPPRSTPAIAPQARLGQQRREHEPLRIRELHPVASQQEDTRMPACQMPVTFMR